LPDAVNMLKQKYGVSKQAIYQDWVRRGKWLSTIMSLDNPEHFTLELMSTRREIYRLAAKEYLSGDYSASRVGALRLMNDILQNEWEMVEPILKNKAFNAVTDAKNESNMDLLRRYDAVFGPSEKAKAIESLKQYKAIIDVGWEDEHEIPDLANCSPEERELIRQANQIILREREKAKGDRPENVERLLDQVYGKDLREGSWVEPILLQMPRAMQRD